MMQKQVIDGLIDSDTHRLLQSRVRNGKVERQVGNDDISNCKTENHNTFNEMNENYNIQKPSRSLSYHRYDTENVSKYTHVVCLSPEAMSIQICCGDMLVNQSAEQRLQPASYSTSLKNVSRWRDTVL